MFSNYNMVIFLCIYYAGDPISLSDGATGVTANSTESEGITWLL